MSETSPDSRGNLKAVNKNVLLISLQVDLSVIGLRYIHYCLLRAGYQSYYLHIPRFGSNNLRALDGLRRFVEEINPLFIGISLVSTEYAKARAISQYLKHQFPKTPIIWGGIHPTIDPQSCFPFADFICIGEGEQAVVAFAEALSAGQDPLQVKNICFMQNGELVKNQLYPLINDLDTLPIIDHITSNGFLQEWSGKISPMNRKLAMEYGRYQHKFYDIATSRGCPFCCAYCCSDMVSRLYGSKKIRKRSVENVIAEMERAVRDHPFIQMVNFQDENFLSHDLDFIRDFSAAYRERVRKPFMFACIPLYVTRDKMKLLREAGLIWVRIGLQSGSDRVLKDIYKRKSLTADFLKAMDVLRDLQIAVYCDVILDNPFESPADKLDTIKILSKTPGPFYLQLYSLIAYFGSEIYDRIIRECPDQLEDSKEKDLLFYLKTPLNDLTWISAYIPNQLSLKLMEWYQGNPQGIQFKIALALAKALCVIFFEPVAYFRVFKMSQGGSLIKLLRVMPTYLRMWFIRYSKHFTQT